MTNNYLPTDYQTFIHQSRYARWLDDEGRRESWDDTVSRLVNYYTDFARLDRDTSVYLQDKILGLEVMPSMRAMMTAGPALDRNHLAAYNCSYLAVDSPRAFDECMFILMHGTGVGFSVERQYINQLPRLPEEFGDTETTIIVADSKEGWQRGFKELVNLLLAGRIPQWDMSRVRPAGARLKTFGGRASGPEPLHDLFVFTCNMFKGAAGRRLTSLECHDLMCKIAEVIVVGGVRRCLPVGSKVHSRFGIKNIEDIKVDDEVLTTQGYKRVSNKFYQGRQALVTVQTQDSSFDCTPNHRVAVLTSFDEYTWKKAEDLEFGDRIIAPSFGVEGVKTTLPSFQYKYPKHSTTCKEITLPKLDRDSAWLLGMIQGDGYVRLTSNSGEVCIPYHNDHINMGEKAEKQLRRFGVNVGKITYENYSVLKVKSKQLAEYFHSWLKQPKTELSVPDFIWKATSEIKLAYVSGLMDADGSVKIRPVQVLCSIYESFVKDVQILLSSCGIQTRVKSLSEAGLKEGWQKKYALTIINNSSKKAFKNIPSLHKKDFKIPSKEQFSNTYPLSWKRNGERAWSSTDNTLIPVAVISVEDKNVQEDTWDIVVEDVHEFFCNGYLVHNSALISLSNLSDGRMRHAKSGAWYDTDPHRALSNNSVCYTDKPDCGTFMREWIALYESKSGERGIFNRQAAQEQAARFDRREKCIDYGTNPCSEIILRNKQLCNLSEVIVRSTDTFATLKDKVEAATILGTVQSMFTDFKGVSTRWKRNTEEERLLGVSLTGILDHKFMSKPSKQLSDMLVALREHAVQVNQKWADKFGIEHSAAITCVKPSGTVSQLVDSSSGIHARHHNQYIRTVRADVKDPMTQFMVDQGIPNEPCVLKPDTTVVFSFPTEAPKGAVTRNDMSAIEHLELWKMYAQDWCEHKPSITVSVKDDEWMRVGSYVYDNFDIMSGVSFLPLTEHVYKQAPYQDCTRKQYRAALAAMPKRIDWSKLSEYEREDNTHGSQTFNCTGGVCEVVDLV